MRQILYKMAISYVDKTLVYSKDKTGKSMEQIEEETHNTLARITGDGQYNNFGPMLNDTLHRLYPETSHIKVLNARICNWQSYDDSSDPILPNGIRPSMMAEMNQNLSDDEQTMIIDATNNLIHELLSDTFEANATKAITSTLSGRLSFSEVWNADTVKQYFEDKEKAEQEEKAFFQSLEPPQPYLGKKYAAELSFTFASPVKDMAEAEAKMNEVPMKKILDDQLMYTPEWTKPRTIIDTHVSLTSPHEGVLRIELTKPVKECGAAWLNSAKWSFGKNGDFTKCVKKNDLIDMSNIKKGAVFAAYSNKVVAVDIPEDYEDFAAAVSEIKDTNDMNI